MTVLSSDPFRNIIILEFFSESVQKLVSDGDKKRYFKIAAAMAQGVIFAKSAQVFDWFNLDNSIIRFLFDEKIACRVNS